VCFLRWRYSSAGVFRDEADRSRVFAYAASVLTGRGERVRCEGESVVDMISVCVFRDSLVGMETVGCVFNDFFVAPKHSCTANALDVETHA
jgi:hypothetical protein